MSPRRVTLLAVAVAIAALLSLAAGECPNGCSGNGRCAPKDVCDCFENFQGNDCSERTCLFAYAHVDTPRGDLDMDQDRKTTGWFLTQSQQAPAGTYEYFHPSAAQHEAHFYLECANKGICDRSSGLCDCFDGYEGNGCARTTCPNKCSGHGTCHSIRQLGEKAAGTLFGTEMPSGSMGYDLWDANSTYGCRCDPWYDGADCSRRTCKVGVDPLYRSAGTPTLETFVVHAYDTAATAFTSGSLTLRVFDYYGESYITKPIAFADDAVTADADANAVAVAAAINELPNLSFQNVLCEAVASTTGTLGGFLSTRATGLGMSVVCKFRENPGKLRIPEVASVTIVGAAATTATTFGKVVTTTNQGWDDDWFPVQTEAVVDPATDVSGGPVTTWNRLGTNTIDIAVAIAITTDPVLVKLGPHIVLAKPTSTVTAVLELVYPLGHALTSPDAIIFKADPDSGLAVSVLPALSAGVVVGTAQMTFTTDPSLATGDLLFYENQFFTVQQAWLNTLYYVNLDKPFGGNTADGGDSVVGNLVYKVTRPSSTKVYNYVSPCSGRGLCSAETGLCTCFKGYGRDVCDYQSVMAL